MVHKTLLRTLLIVFLTVCLTACASLASAGGREPAYSPNSKTDIEPLLDEGKSLADWMVEPSLVSSTAPLFTSVVQDSPLSIQQTFIDLYEQVNPSVVNVQVESTPDVNDMNEEFAPFFPQIPGFPQNTPEIEPPMSILPQ